MTVKFSVQLAEAFQKLSAAEQFALRVMSINGLETFPSANLKLLQLAIYKWLKPLTGYTGPEPDIVAELLELQHQISNRLNGDTTNMHS